MQLAAMLGDHPTLRHLLRKQCEVEWLWGPIASYSLDLEGIDSAGMGGGDIMVPSSPHTRASRAVGTAILCHPLPVMPFTLPTLPPRLFL